MDIDLGEGIDGPEAARQILMTCHIPIVFLTSHAEKEYVDRVKEITRYGYILKGSSAFVLQESIQMAFELFEKHELIQNKEQMQNAIINSISDVIAVLNRDGVVTYISPNIVKRFGWREDEILGTPVWGRIHPDDIESTRTILNKTINAPEANLTERCRYRYRDGRYRWIEYTAVNCYNIPEIKGVLINYRDITEEKISQESLKEREYTLQKIFDILPVGLWFADKHGKLLKGNPTGKKIWGAEPKVSPEDYGFFKARRLPSGEEIAPDDWALAHTITKGITIENELLEIDAFDGETRTILNFTAPVLDENNNIMGAIIVNQDISEQKKIENDLNESMERFKALHDASFGGIAIHDQGGIIECNLGLAELTGYSEDELTGMDGLELIAPESREYVNKQIISGYGAPYDAKGIKKDGSIYDLRIQGENIPYMGKTVRVTEFRDISESKAAEESIKIKNEELEALNEELTASMEEMEATNEEFARANEELLETNTRLIQMEKNLKMSLNELESSEARFRIFAETAPVGILISDHEEKVMYLNPKFIEMFGYTIEDMPSINEWWPLAYPDKAFRKSVQEKWKGDVETAIREASEIGPVEYPVTCKDGSVKTIQFHFASNGELNVVLFTDITWKKEAELQLAESESRYRFITENVVDVIWTTDMNLNLTYVSPSVERQQGFTAGEMKGIPLEKRFPPESIEKVSEILAIELDKEKNPDSNKTREIRLETKAYKKDKSIYWADFNITFLRDGEGNAIGFQGVTRDITERKEAELKINNLLKEKEILLKEVHHRIKNNMNTICGLLMIQAENPDNDSAKNALYDAAGRIRSMMVLYDQLYRSDGFREVSLEKYFPPLINEIISNFSSAKNVTVSTDIDDIYADTDLLSPLGIIISELLTNIMKHAFKDKSEGEIFVSAKEDSGSAVITVKDNGSGIPESIDFDNSTGFGLQLIDMLIDQIKGEVEINRKNGTEFKFIIPLKNEL
jgi:PAS domain S-box-containing protein